MSPKLMIGAACAAVAGGLAVAMGGGPPADAQTHETSAGTVMVERVAGPMDEPWGIGFLPGGEMLVTEKGGRLLRVSETGDIREISGVPRVEDGGQGGLLDVLVPSDHPESGEILFTYSAPAPNGATRTTLASARLREASLESVGVLWQQEPPVASGRHFGSRIVERPDGTLFVTIGDRGDRPLAQHTDKTIGKVVRLARDGSVPADNPFVGQEGVAPEIWSIGHRNQQGADLDADGRLWTVEHGARGGDEINRPEAGKNYGWPRISYGTHYSGASFPGTEATGLEQPVHYWDPSIAPSGLAVYSGALWPEWEGDIFVGALKYNLVSRLERDGDRVTGEERLFEDVYGRIRDIKEGPDGALWFVTDESDGGLYRITPAR